MPEIRLSAKLLPSKALSSKGSSAPAAPAKANSDAPSGQARSAASPPGGRKTCRRVAACVMRDFGVDRGCLMAPSRGSPRVSLARQVAMYLCHVAFAMNFEAIGRAFGRDRTTVAHACKVIEDRRDDIWFDCRMAALERACGVDNAERAR